MTPAPDLSIAIIGAGFSGIGMAIRLQQSGLRDFTILEAASDIGGTWRDNTYPGCACDVPSHLYSFSFEQNPDWSRKFSRQPEILEYLRRCVDQHGLAPRIRFDTRIERAVFDEPAGLWRLHTARGETLSARVVISGTGPLSRPATPDLPGLHRFAGHTFHSARWDHDYDLAGKRVAVVGTGASAIQFVPRIAKKVARLHVFQRTPPWVMPKADRAFARFTRVLFSRLPFVERLYRWLTYWSYEARALGFVVDPRLMGVLASLGRAHIRKQIADPALRRLVTPDYTPGCKRILLSNDYYPALARDHVELIPQPAVSVEEHAIVAADGTRREVDAIVFGTGFDLAGLASSIDIVGLSGRRLADAWRARPEALLGLAVTGFPNLYFLVSGPNTGLGHNSIVFMIEAQIDYVLRCLTRLRDRRLRYLDVTEDGQRAFTEALRPRLDRTVWQSGCKSWYLDDQGRNFTLWPGFTFEYWLRTRQRPKDAIREVA